MEYLKFYGQKPIDVVFVSSQIRQGFFRFNIRFFYTFFLYFFACINHFYILIRTSVKAHTAGNTFITVNFNLVN